jgi:hypothetical protein
VSWSPPVGSYRIGAYVAPLGPPPTAATKAVNGIVTCVGSTFAYLGFEAAWRGGRWHLAAVPASTAEVDTPVLTGEDAAAGAEPANAAAAAGGGAASLPPAQAWDGLAIEPLAPYVPQTTCDPSAKAGVLGFRDLLLTSFPGTRNLGIGRLCEADGVSEHKEGRAFDWGVSADDPAERAAVDGVLAWLFGPDGDGNPEAMARRLGLMYVIWDGQIWSSFHDDEGWRPYVGVSTHRDHVHFSFSWDGALARTSFWAGGHAPVVPGAGPDLPLARPAPVVLPPVLPVAPTAPTASLAGIGEPPAPTDAPAAPGPAPTTTSTTTTSTTTTTTAPPSTTTTTAPAPSPVTVPPAPAPTIGVGGI